MVTTARLRVVFFGTPDFAVPTLDALLRSAHTVAGVVTQPDRPSGRGQHTANSPVKAAALRAGVPVLQPERLGDPVFLDALDALHADIGVVAAYGKILPERVLNTPRLGMVNVHASLLPRYRGAAPVHRAIIAGERDTGVTIMRVVKALDAGPMLATSRRPIGPDETSDAVEYDLARLGATLLASTVDDIAAGRSAETPQEDARATYAHRLTKDDGRVDWGRPAAHIHNLVRGLHPWPHAFTYLGTTRYIVLASSAFREPPWAASAAPGTIVEARGDRLLVATGDGTLQITRIQAEGKRPMTAREFLAGHPIERGARFGAA